MRKTCAILRDCFSLQLSAGGLSQALDRLIEPISINEFLFEMRGRLS
jgi:hypothetical protein